jgi:Tat protein translocase TatB subunit
MDFLGVGVPEVIVIIMLALIFIGPRDLPRMAARFGKFVRDLRMMSEGFTTEWRRELEAAVRLEELQEIKEELQETGQILKESGRDIKGEMRVDKKDLDPEAKKAQSPTPKSADKTVSRTTAKTPNGVKEGEAKTADESPAVDPELAAAAGPAINGTHENGKVTAQTEDKAEATSEAVEEAVEETLAEEVDTSASEPVIAPPDLQTKTQVEPPTVVASPETAEPEPKSDADEVPPPVKKTRPKKVTAKKKADSSLEATEASPEAVNAPQVEEEANPESAKPAVSPTTEAEETAPAGDDSSDPTPQTQLEEPSSREPN